MIDECSFFEELFVVATNLLTSPCVGDPLLDVFPCYVRSVIFFKEGVHFELESSVSFSSCFLLV